MIEEALPLLCIALTGAVAGGAAVAGLGRRPDPTDPAPSVDTSDIEEAMAGESPADEMADVVRRSRR